MFKARQQSSFFVPRLPVLTNTPFTSNTVNIRNVTSKRLKYKWFMNNYKNIKDSLKKILNTHGYGFQYALLRLVCTLQDDARGNWNFVAAEFPVEVRNKSTRIDFILKNKNNNIYLICECKRVNPAYGYWVFLKSPHVHETYKFGSILGEEIKLIAGFVSTGLSNINNYKDIYHIGIAIKTNKKGDCNKHDKDSIEETATQVSRGLNGFVHFISRETQLIKERKITLIPVIFTTAQIFTCNVDIGMSELNTGEINLDDSTIESKKWIWYRYHQSPGITHELSSRKGLGKIGAILDAKYARTIAIVNSEGAEDFLTKDWWDQSV